MALNCNGGESKPQNPRECKNKDQQLSPFDQTLLAFQKEQNDTTNPDTFTLENLGDHVQQSNMNGTADSLPSYDKSSDKMDLYLNRMIHPKTEYSMSNDCDSQSTTKRKNSKPSRPSVTWKLEPLVDKDENSHDDTEYKRKVLSAIKQDNQAEFTQYETNIQIEESLKDNKGETLLTKHFISKSPRHKPRKLISRKTGPKNNLTDRRALESIQKPSMTPDEHHVKGIETIDHTGYHSILNALHFETDGILSSLLNETLIHFEDFKYSMKQMIKEVIGKEEEENMLDPESRIVVHKCALSNSIIKSIINSYESVDDRRSNLFNNTNDLLLFDSCHYCHGQSYSDPRMIEYMPTSVSRYNDFSVASPILVPFTLSTSHISQCFSSLLVKNELFGRVLNCFHCDAPIHLECYREYKLRCSYPLPLSFPLTFIKDEDLKLKAMLYDPNTKPLPLKAPIMIKYPQQSLIKYPEAVIDLKEVICDYCLPIDMINELDSNHHHHENSAFFEKHTTCSRCWKHFPLAVSPTLSVPGDSNVSETASNSIYGESIEQAEIYQESELYVGKVWVCKSCLVCSYCGTCSSEGTDWADLKGPMSSWHSIAIPIPNTKTSKGAFLFCEECYQCLLRKYFCPLCSRLYNPGNFTIPMLECQTCCSWVHLACDPVLDGKEYDRMGRGDCSAADTVSYSCKLCRNSAENGGSVKQYEASNPESANSISHLKEPLKNNIKFKECHMDQLIKDVFLQEFKINSSQAFNGFKRFGPVMLFNIGQLLYNSTSQCFIETTLCPMNYIAARWYPSYRHSNKRTLYLFFTEHAKDLNVGIKINVLALDDIKNKISITRFEGTFCYVGIYSTCLDWKSIWVHRWDHCKPPGLSLDLEWFIGLKNYWILKEIEHLPQIFSYADVEHTSNKREVNYMIAFNEWENSSNTARLRSCYPRKCYIRELESKGLDYYYNAYNLAEITQNLKKSYTLRIDKIHRLDFQSKQSTKRTLIPDPSTFRSTNAFEVHLGTQYSSMLRKRAVETKESPFLSPRLLNCGIDLRSLALMRSPIQGFGVFTLEAIPPGMIIVEYKGELVGKKVANEREKYYDQNSIGCYFFKLDDGLIIDATMKGNVARYINHSCDPNCYATHCYVENAKKVVLIISKRLIAPLEELTYDYKFSIEDGVKIPCRCRAKKCRKFM